MKPIFVILLLVFFNVSNAQTSTKKYNSYLERYEYFDSNGNMVGYQSYNSYLDQWEYTEVNTSNNSSNYYDNIPVYEPNYDLINKALAAKENRYSTNQATFDNLLREVGEKFRSYYGAGSTSHIEAIERFKLLMDYRFDKWTNSSGKIDISNSNVWRGLRNDIIDAFNKTIKNIPHEPDYAKTTSERYPKASNEKYSWLKYKGAKIRSEPNLDSRINYETQKIEQVKILKEENSWVRVEVNNITGYVLKSWVEGYDNTSTKKNNRSSQAKFKYTGAKLRTEPSINSELVYESKKKESVQILKKLRDSDWLKVEVNGKVGYINKSWVE